MTPSKRNSRPRQWLTYLSLLVSALVVVSDLMTLVFNALGGELSIKFLLKISVVALISGGIFVYFLLNIRKGEQE